MPERESNNFYSKWLVSLLLIVIAFVIIFFLFKSLPPQILSASVYPEKVMPGQIMIVTAQVNSIGIKSATAIFGNEKMPDGRNIPLITGTKRNGVYETRWIVHDTLSQAWYNTTIIFTDILGKKSIQTIEWQDPTTSHTASEITSGTFSGNYNFTGNLTANSTITLTQQASSPSNLTGFGKIYYKASDLDTYTKLLLHADGTNGSTIFTDSATGKAVTAYGQAHITTQYYKFGTGSARFDGNWDNLSLADSDDWSFGTGDFTIDFWFRKIATGNMDLFSQGDTSSLTTTSIFMGVWGGALYTRVSNGVAGYHYQPDGTTTILLDTWYHYALVRNGNSIQTYLNGAVESSAGDVTGDTYVNSPAPFLIGAKIYGDWNGSIDEFRISKGIARWTSAFSVPTSAYSVGSAGGLMFMHENGTSVTLVPA